MGGITSITANDPRRHAAWRELNDDQKERLKNLARPVARGDREKALLMLACDLDKGGRGFAAFCAASQAEAMLVAAIYRIVGRTAMLYPDIVNDGLSDEQRGMMKDFDDLRGKTLAQVPDTDGQRTRICALYEAALGPVHQRQAGDIGHS